MEEPRRRREREAAWGASSVKPLFHPGLVKPSVVPLREVRYLEPETPQSWLINLNGREVAHLQEGEHRRLPSQPRVTDTLVVWSGNGRGEGWSSPSLGTQHHEYSRPICRRPTLNIMSTVVPSAVDQHSTS